MFGIADAYVEIEYNGEKAESIHIQKEDYKIQTKSELETFRDNVNNGKNYDGITITQLADINLEGSSTDKWTAIGSATNTFKGTYDGQKHIIKNIYLDNDLNYQGLFGYSCGNIKNLIIQDSYFNSTYSKTTTENFDGTDITSINVHCGGIVGKNDGGSIENCILKNSQINARGNNIGGIVGWNNSGKIINCQNFATITNTGDFATGGIVGWNHKNSIIQNCVNLGKINGMKNVGGIAGTSETNCTISNCSNSGNISSSYRKVGGIVGIIEKNSKLENSYNSGNITVITTEKLDDNNYHTYVGGIAGVCNKESYINLSYNIGTITSNGIGTGGICGVVWSNINSSENYGLSIVENCYNKGEIISDYYQTGGVCGFVGNYSKLRKCYNEGKVSGNSQLGGVVGMLGYYDIGYIENCYNKGEITATGDNVGGVCGYVYRGNIKNSYNIGAISTSTTKYGGIAVYPADSITKDFSNCYYLSSIITGGINGADVSGQAEGKTETEMKSSIILNSLNSLEALTWINDSNNFNNGYPIFSWQTQ